jgi:hypothetical protein
VAFLRDDLHTRQVANKQDGGLVSPAVFNPDLSNATSRGLDNIEYIRGIWMDNDGGDLSPDEFARIFPQLRMYIYNTHSHTAEAPRWRVFIPTSRAMPVVAHQLMMRQIERSLNAAGYWSKSDLKNKSRIKSRCLHGFDESKFNGASLFYLPCKAKNPADSFFHEFTNGGRKALDVDQWVTRAISDPKFSLSRYEDRGTDPITAPRVILDVPNEAVSNAISEWRIATVGGGNEAFFRLGLKLREAGLSFEDVESVLSREAMQGRSPDKRRGQIKSILQSLRLREGRTDRVRSSVTLVQ